MGCIAAMGEEDLFSRSDSGAECSRIRPGDGRSGGRADGFPARAFRASPSGPPRSDQSGKVKESKIGAFAKLQFPRLTRAVPGCVWAVKKGTQLFNACPMRHASTRGRLAGISAGIAFGKICIKGGLEARCNKWSGGLPAGCFETICNGCVASSGRSGSALALGMAFTGTLGRVTSITIGTVAACHRRAS